MERINFVKYLKYKDKYLKLKNQIGGILLPVIDDYLIEANHGRNTYIDNEKYIGIIYVYNDRYNKHIVPNWADVLHATGNTIPNELLLEIAQEALFKFYIEHCFEFAKNWVPIDDFIDNPQPETFIIFMSMLKKYFGTNIEPEFTRLQKLADALRSNDKYDILKSIYSKENMGVFKNYLIQMKIYNYLITQVNKLRIFEIIKTKLKEIYKNPNLQKLGIVYERLKIISEKKWNFLNPKNEYYYIDPAVRALKGVELENYKKIGNILDKFINIIQTMIYKHIEQITHKIVAAANVQPNGVGAADAGAAVGDILDMIALHDPDFYEEPEYKIILRHLDSLSEPVEHNEIKNFKLPDEIVAIIP